MRTAGPSPAHASQPPPESLVASDPQLRPCAWLALALAGFVVGADLLWPLLGVSSGSLAYGLADEPAHLATCAVALLCVARVGIPRLSVRFATAALLASVAIEVDHVPGYLGSRVLAGSLPRPYSHSMMLVAVLVTLGWLCSRPGPRELFFGVAFGVSLHLLRDLATGPGAPLVWPISGATITLPYELFGALLAMFTLGAAVGGRICPRRGSFVRSPVFASAPRQRLRREATRSGSSGSWDS